MIVESGRNWTPLLDAAVLADEPPEEDEQAWLDENFRETQWLDDEVRR